MKLQVLNSEGQKVKEISTKLFEEPIREDIIFKVIEAQKIKQPYGPYLLAGMDRSASGNVKKTRKVWKSDRGKGLARIPKMTMWRRGTQFSWVGAIVPGTRGGRRAHPPRPIEVEKKINKKELKKALLSALTYVSSVEEVKKKYATLNDKKIGKTLPIVVEKDILELNTKKFLETIKKVLGDFEDIIIQKKTLRTGVGKSRGRKTKKCRLLLSWNDERKMLKESK
jgi:ribosomal protein L4